MSQFAVSFVSDIFPKASRAGTTGRWRRSGSLGRAGSNRSPEMQHAETVRQCAEGHQEEEGTGEITVHAPTAEGVHNTCHAHCAERHSPDHCSLTAADGRNPGYDNRNSRKPIQEENTQPA
jgi:hypothetical protein